MSFTDALVAYGDPLGRLALRSVHIEAETTIRCGPEPLDPTEALGCVATPEAGGTALFSGTVRSPNAGVEVDHLHYEVWAEQVSDELAAIAREAVDRFGACRVYVAHRSGRVEIGEASVLVAASAPHRAEAFDACRYVIDTLKERASIWKKEVTMDGTHWVGMPR